MGNSTVRRVCTPCNQGEGLHAERRYTCRVCGAECCQHNDHHRHRKPFVHIGKKKDK